MDGTRHNVRCAGVLLYDKRPGVMLSAAGAERIRGGLRFRSCRKRAWKQGTQTSRRLKQGAGGVVLAGRGDGDFGGTAVMRLRRRRCVWKNLSAHMKAQQRMIFLYLSVFIINNITLEILQSR